MGGQFQSPSCEFSKTVSSKKRVKPWFFVTFDIIIRHIFPENFHWNSSILSEYMKIFFVNINYFHQNFEFFWHFLVANKLMTSAYNRWCQHFCTFNLFWTDCLTIVSRYWILDRYYILILDRLFLKYEGGLNWPTLHPR